MNNVSLVGRLTKDVELRYTTKKMKAVGSFVLAVDRDIKKVSGDKTADFIPIVTWGKTAEFASKYFAKGHRIALQGSIHTRMWEDDEKNRHYVTEVVADRVYFADAKQKEFDDDEGQEDIEGDIGEEIDEEVSNETVEAAASVR
jgi:single-strand DNA-binding protein